MLELASASEEIQEIISLPFDEFSEEFMGMDITDEIKASVSEKVDETILENQSNFSIITSGKKKGLYKTITSSDGKDKKVRIGDCIYVLSRTRTHNSDDWGLYIRWEDPDGQIHKMVITYEHLYASNSDWFTQIVRGGWKGQKKDLFDFLTQSETKERSICTNQVGWHGQIYVLPTQCISKNEEKAIFQKQINLNLYTSSGSYEVI